MDKKSLYRPVSDKMTRTTSKTLAQGTLGTGNKTRKKETTASLHSSTKSNRSDSLETSTARNKSKVICHSPHVHHSKTTGTAHKVTVDVPPTIFITSNNSCHGDSGIHNSNSVGIDDTPLDLSSTARQVFTGKDTSPRSTLTAQSTVKSTSPRNVSSRISSAPNRVNPGLTKQVPATGKENALKRKKVVKVVESRYKSATTKSNPKPNLPTQANNTSSKSRPRPPSKVEVVPTPAVTRSEMLAKVSTPNAGFKSFFNADVSNVEPYRKEVLHAAQNESHSASRLPQQAQQHETHNLTQSNVDLKYSAYLRLFYLRHKMQQAFESRSRQGLEELSFLVDSNLTLQEELTSLEEEDIIVRHEEQLEKTLEAQINALAPVIDKLDNVGDKYNTLVENLDTTRHGLPLRDVTVPDVIKLERNLLKTREILGDASTLIRTHTDSCSEAATKSRDLQALVVEQRSALNETESKCAEVSTLRVKQMAHQMQLYLEER